MYLQWTTIGPEKVGLMALTFLRNFNIPMGENGTPKSGQLVKWSWVSGLGVLAASLACCTQTETKTHHLQVQRDSTKLQRAGLLVPREHKRTV